MYIGIVDIGSNTIRLIIYSIDKNKNTKKIFSYKETAGLAAYVEDGALCDNGFYVLEKTLTNIKKITDELNISYVWYFATASLRNISNTSKVVGKIKKKLNIDIDVISNEDEGYLSYYAMRHLINDKTDKANGILADIGGGSSEIVIFKKNKIIENQSLPIGSLNLYRKFVKEILPTKEEVANIQQEISSYIDTISNGCDFKTLIGIGGTFRLIPSLIGIDSTTFAVKDFYKLLDYSDNTSHMSQLILKSKPERIHTAIPGMLIAQSILKKWNVSEVLTDRVSVRDGYLLKKLYGGN